jgi:hypothetical protein
MLMRLICMLALIDPSDLPPDFDAMRRIALDQNRIAHDLWTQVELLKHPLAQFVRARFGASSEQLPGQGCWRWRRIDPRRWDSLPHPTNKETQVPCGV